MTRTRLLHRLRRLLHGDEFDLDTGVNGLLTSRGLPPLDGPPRAIANRDGNLASGESVYETRPDVRRALPLALTPAGRRTYLDWFLDNGQHETTATLADVLLALFDQDARPDRGLVAAYLVQPAWQAKFPDALTPAGWEAFKRWLAAEYGIRGRWLRRAKLPRDAATPQAAGGVNVLAFFRYSSGLKEAATALVEALSAAGVPTSLRDLPKPINRDGRPRGGFDGLERFPVTIVNTGLDTPVAEAYRLAALHPRPGIYRVAVWWWELEQLLPEWLDRGRDVDEIWAPTAFVAHAFAPLGKPVFTLPPSVELPAFDPLPKAAFGLDPDRFTFLFAFDMNSRLPRKNPLGLIRAFRRAFAPSEPVELAIKVGTQERLYPEAWRELRAATAEAGVKLIDRTMPRTELLALMNAADAYVSLHRSEGFGLTMAEAMLLGKPTAATAYSGNLDFMTAANSYLIDHTLVPVVDPAVPIPAGAVWAEPSGEQAAAVMRGIVQHPAEAAERGRRAQAELRVKLSHRAAGERMAARLRAIAEGRR